MSRNKRKDVIPMNMRIQLKTVSLVLAGLVLAAGLSACGGGGGSSSSSGGTLAQGSDPTVNGSSGSGSGSALVASSAVQVEERHMMTVDETADFFLKLTPKELGLEGESMEEYEVYPSEKAVPVNGLPCMKLIVYQKSTAGTNAPVSTYLVARDGTAVYQIQGEIAVELELF